MNSKLFFALFAHFLPLTLAAPSKESNFVQIRENKASIPFATKLNYLGGKIPDIDRAHVASLIHGTKKLNQDSAAFALAEGQYSVPVINQALIYTANVSIGNPPTVYSLIIDTGSSNTWVGANKPYIPTDTTGIDEDLVLVAYGSGAFSGLELCDQVALSPDLVIQCQEIGVALISKGFQGVDGILGVGPANLTEGTLILHPGETIPTVTDNLFSQGTIPEEIIGIYFAPTTTDQSTNGEMTFGGINNNRTTRDVEFVPITSTSPAGNYWGIDQDVTYGTSNTTILSSGSGIVDTGTTLLLLATDAFNNYVSATGATVDSDTGLLYISPESYANIQSLFFQVGNTTFEFTRDAQTFPRALNTVIGGSSDKIYLVIGDLGMESGQGLDFINGYAFLERFYSVYDTTNQRVGLAPTENTFSVINYNQTA